VDFKITTSKPGKLKESIKSLKRTNIHVTGSLRDDGTTPILVQHETRGLVEG